MSLTKYFDGLLQRVEASEIGNNGKDANGFFSPTRALLVRHLTLLKDLHGKPRAKAMAKASWDFVVDHVPPEWLTPNESERDELRALLES